MECNFKGAVIVRNAESCHRGVICGKSSAERSANNPLSLLPHSPAKKFSISADCKTTVYSHCTTDVQLMHSSIQHPVVPSFRILCDLFAKERGSFLSHHTVVWLGYLSLLCFWSFCHFVFCMVTHFSGVNRQFLLFGQLQ